MQNNSMTIQDVAASLIVGGFIGATFGFSARLITNYIQKNYLDDKYNCLDCGRKYHICKLCNLAYVNENPQVERSNELCVDCMKMTKVSKDQVTFTQLSYLKDVINRQQMQSSLDRNYLAKILDRDTAALDNLRAEFKKILDAVQVNRGMLINSTDVDGNTTVQDDSVCLSEELN